MALTLSDLAYFTATGVLLVATPLFITGPLGSDEAGVGLAMGSFSVTTLLLRPLAGRWTDRHGRRALLIGGAVLFAVVVLGHYLVTGLAGLVVLRLLLGAAEALYFVAGFAALADLAPPGRAGEALSLPRTTVPTTSPTGLCAAPIARKPTAGRCGPPRLTVVFSRTHFWASGSSSAMSSWRPTLASWSTMTVRPTFAVAERPTPSSCPIRLLTGCGRRV